MTVLPDRGAASRLRFGPVELEVPEGWEQQRIVDVDAHLVAPRPPGRTFRANVVVTSRPAAGSSRMHVEDLLRGAAAAGRVLAVEPFPAIGAIGRRIESVYLAGRTAVRVTTLATSAEGRDIELTLSRLLLPSAAVFEAVDRITSSLVVHGVDDSEGDGEGEPILPPIDDELEPPLSFPPISGDAWRLLWRSAGHGFQPGPARSPEGRELREAGLMTAFGGTTPDCERLLRIARSARRGTIRRTDADGDTIRSMWSADGGTAVDLGRVVSEPPVVRTHALMLEPMGPAALRLFDWLGVAPTHASSGEEHAQVRDEVVAARLRGPVAAPDGVGPALAAAWRTGTWAAFDVTTDGAPAVLRALRGGDGTWWTQGPAAEDGSTRLRAVRASTIIDLLTGGSTW